jgi:hypothetical protein
MAAILAPTTWRDRLFGLSVLGAPLLAATVFAPAAGARGYIVYGMSIWLYCCSGAWLAWGVARGRGMAALSLIVLGMALAAQVGWSTAHWGGWLGPAKTYFLGWDDGWPVLRNEPTQVVSLTGEEPTPVAFGGGETLVEAGAVVEPAEGFVPRKSRVLAWLSRFPLLFGLLLWGGAWFPKRRGRRWLTAWAIVQLVIGGECSHRRLDNVPTPYVPQGAVTLAAGETATLRLHVATGELAGLRERFRRGESRLGLFVPSAGRLDLALHAGGATVPLDEEDTGFFAITEAEAALEVLEQADWELTLRAAGSEPVTFTGWQRRGLPGREFTGGEGLALPVVELRLIHREDGFLEAAAF